MNSYAYHFVKPKIEGETIGDLLLKQTRGEFLTREEKERVKKYEAEQRKKNKCRR